MEGGAMGGPLAKIAAVAFIWSAATAASAENFNLFGRQPNFCASRRGRKGLCASAAAINSFIFLENKYPKVYGPKKLTPNVSGPVGGQTDHKDTLAFANLTYYKGAETQAQLDNLYLADLKTWFAQHGGNTTIDSEFPDSPNNNSVPQFSFLQTQEQQQEDVILFIEDVQYPGDKHAITLTGAGCTRHPEICTITYQNPNRPNTEQSANITDLSNSGGMEFTGLPGQGPLSNDTWEIYAAFSESPVNAETPEPGVWTMMGLGFAAIGGLMRRRKAAVAAGPRPTD